MLIPFNAQGMTSSTEPMLIAAQSISSNSVIAFSNCSIVGSRGMLLGEDSISFVKLKKFWVYNCLQLTSDRLAAVADFPNQTFGRSRNVNLVKNFQPKPLA